MSVLPHPSASSGHRESPSDALTIIRSATAACHADMEGVIDWALAFSAPDRYRHLLRCYQRVVEPLEAKLATFDAARGGELSSDHSSSDHPPIKSTRYCRVSQLQSDIAALQCYGDDVGSPQLDINWVNTDFIVDHCAALGVDYVLEGSALGGQILSKQLRKGASHWPAVRTKSSEVSDSGPFIDRYFVGRGAETGASWKEFCIRLNRELPDIQSANAAARAAVTTFEYFRLSFAGKLS